MICHGPSYQFWKGFHTGLWHGSSWEKWKRSRETGLEPSLRLTWRATWGRMSGRWQLRSAREARLGNASSLFRNLSRCQDISAKSVIFSGLSSTLLGKYFLFLGKRCLFYLPFTLWVSGSAGWTELNSSQTNCFDVFKTHADDQVGVTVRSSAAFSKNRRVGQCNGGRSFLYMFTSCIQV